MALTKEWESQIDKMNKLNESDVCYAVQEWGIKNDLRLFGFSLKVMEKQNNGKRGAPTITALGYFVDKIGFREMSMIYFDIAQNGARITVTRRKGKQTGFKWPVRFAQTKHFENDRIDPVCPIYDLLVSKGIILPFKNTISGKAWKALPFVDGYDLQTTEI